MWVGEVYLYVAENVPKNFTQMCDKLDFLRWIIFGEIFLRLVIFGENFQSHFPDDGEYQMGSKWIRSRAPWAVAYMATSALKSMRKQSWYCEGIYLLAKFYEIFNVECLLSLLYVIVLHN